MIAEIENEYIALARAVIAQAARDAASGDRAAAAWLASDETADIWFFVAGVRRSAVIAWLGKGCKIRANIKRQTKTTNNKRKTTARTIPAMG